VQISEASYTGSLLYGPGAAVASRTVVPQTSDLNYKLPRGFGDEDLHTRALNKRGSELPDISTVNKKLPDYNGRVERGAPRGVTSFSTTNEAFQSQVEVITRPHPLDYTVHWSQADREEAYSQALKTVGEQGVDQVLQSVRDKVEQRTRGGLTQLNSAFHFFDKDRSRSIDLPEFDQAMESFGLQFTEIQLTAIFAAHDKGLTGGISYEEFSKAMQKDPVRIRATSNQSSRQPMKARTNERFPAKAERSWGSVKPHGRTSQGPTTTTTAVSKDWEAESALRNDAAREQGPRRIRPPQYRQMC